MRRPSFLRPLWTRLLLAFLRVSRLKRRVRELEHDLTLRQREIASLQVQLTAYQDTVNSLSWERRAFGAEAKYHAENLRHSPG